MTGFPSIVASAGGGLTVGAIVVAAAASPGELVVVGAVADVVGLGARPLALDSGDAAP